MFEKHRWIVKAPDNPTGGVFRCRETAAIGLHLAVTRKSRFPPFDKALAALAATMRAGASVSDPLLPHPRRAGLRPPIDGSD